MWLPGPVWGPSVLGDAGMKGWALAASHDPWNSLADPPLSGGSGDLGSGNRFFFPLSRGVLFARGPERKAGFLPASSCRQGPLETRGSYSSCCINMLWGGGQKVVKRSPRLQTRATLECLSYNQLLPAWRTKEKGIGAHSRKDAG